MRRRGTGFTAIWFVLLAAAQALAFVVVWRFAVGTERGQQLDTIALDGNSIGRDRLDGLVGTILNAMSVVSLVAAILVIGFIALIRGRVNLAVLTTLLVAGANATTQILKYVIQRPDFGVDPERASAGNSLPSGHTTVAASVAVALVLVLPRKARPWGALLGAAYAAAAGVATLSAGWHRPSDAVAALLVVGVWAALTGLLLLRAQRAGTRVAPQDAHRLATVVLGLCGLALLMVAALTIGWIYDVLPTQADDLGRRRLALTYAGGAAGIAGTASLMMALVLVTVHRVVPRQQGRPRRGPQARRSLRSRP
jgi:membrane-associated phospholipid phosphatase